MAIQKAHITWTATSLGASFGAYFVQRFHTTTTTAGWFDIATTTTEATTAFDDWEGVRSVAEQYRVLVQDNLGVRSVAAAAVVAPILSSSTFVIVSNEKPALNIELNAEYPLNPSFPERIQKAAIVGRYGQRLHRSTDRLGEEFALSLDLSGANGPALWRPLVNALRDTTVSYLCVLDPWGNRWFAGLAPKSASMPFFSRGHLAADLNEVTDTPSTVLF